MKPMVLWILYFKKPYVNIYISIYIYIYTSIYNKTRFGERIFYWTLPKMKGLANVGLFINPIFGFVWYSAAHDTGCMRLYSSTEHWEKGISEGK